MCPILSHSSQIALHNFRVEGSKGEKDRKKEKEKERENVRWRESDKRRRTDIWEKRERETEGGKRLSLVSSRPVDLFPFVTSQAIKKERDTFSSFYLLMNINSMLLFYI